jgi:EAL domain-containing protein (putative c-di-GMP-specific phosphodiesterase class I)
MAPNEPINAPQSWPGAGESSAEPSAQVVPSMAEPRARISIGEALRNNWLEIWYQPKIDLKRKALAGAEALGRIQHPQHGFMWPDSFVPDPNEDGVARLTEQAVIATLRDWSIFEEAGFNLHLAINIPVGVLVRMRIAELVREHRPQSERWPGLIIEVTEDQIVRDIKLANEIATELRASGISISIDAFGAGYSSFSSLRALPFAELKLDASFVKNCSTDATSAAICQTAIDLAHRFGSAAVAEGIETATDMQSLIVMGCDFGQGDLIAPPMPQQRFLDLLRLRVNKPRASTAPAAPGAAGPLPAGSIGRVA